MKINKFMIIDLLFLTLLAVLIEYSSIAFGLKFKIMLNKPSLAFAITYIAMFRWEKKSLMIPVITGIVTFIVFKEQQWYMILVYTLGNLFIGINLLWIKFGRKKLTKDISLMFAFVLTGYLSVVLGRTLIITLFEKNLLLNLFCFLIRDVFSTIIIFIVMVIACKQNSLLVKIKEMNWWEEGKSEFCE